MTRFALLALLVAGACSNGSTPPDLKLSDGWARETVTGQKSAAAYLTITNNGTSGDRLLSVSSDSAMHAMLHSTSSDDGVSRMRHVAHGLEIPSKTAVELTPGRTHVMLDGLEQPLQRGDELELVLSFEKSGRQRIAIKVLDPASAGLQEAR